MRINKFISAYSEYSRRKADELIELGKVFLNGKCVKELGTDIDPEKDKVTVNGKNITVNEEKLYFALNKPTNYITSKSDELNRDTVMDLLPKIANLKPVGRLDKDTEGLLLISNDGDFINKLTHPKFECEKEYFAKIKGRLTKEEKEKLETGVIIDGKTTSAAKILVLKLTEEKTEVKITIHEGRNRQVRKMFATVNHPVKYLERIRIGNLKLLSIPKGKYRQLTKQEIDDI